MKNKISFAKQRFKRLHDFVVTSRPYRSFFRFTEVGGNVLSGGMSFQALFAVFASLWVGFGILSEWLQTRTEFLTVLAEQINSGVPGLIAIDGAQGVISIDELVVRGSFDWTSIIASASLIWVSLSWFTGTRRAVRLIFNLEVTQYKNALSLRFRDFLGAVFFAIAILLSTALTFVSSTIFTWLVGALGLSENSWLVTGAGLLVRMIALLAVDVLILMSINRLLAEAPVKAWPLFMGSLLGGLVLLGLKMGGSYVLGSASSNPLLATFAVFVGLLVWFNLICRVILLTSAWIATGQDRKLGLPILEKDLN